MEYVFIGSVILIAWILGHISSQISLQITVISEATRQLKEALEKGEGSSDYADIKYDANDIYKLLEDFPENVAKEINLATGYGRIYGPANIASDFNETNSRLREMEREIAGIREKIRS